MAWKKLTARWLQETEWRQFYTNANYFELNWKALMKLS